jgi:hypothetical protein
VSIHVPFQFDRQNLKIYFYFINAVINKMKTGRQTLISSVCHYQSIRINYYKRSFLYSTLLNVLSWIVSTHDWVKLKLIKKIIIAIITEITHWMNVPKQMSLCFSLFFFRERRIKKIPAFYFVTPLTRPMR